MSNKPLNFKIPRNKQIDVEMPKETQPLLDFRKQETPLGGLKTPPDGCVQGIRLFLRATFGKCNTKWVNTSMLGIIVYVASLCSQYLIGYYAIFTALGWNTPKHNQVRIFGDLVTVGWFALGTIALPWHRWEQLTCLKTKDCKGFARYMAWSVGCTLTFFIYGYMGQFPLFQSSLASDLTPGQYSVYAVTFVVIALIIVYWLGKLCPCRPFKKWCNPKTERKIIFIRLLLLITMIFIISYRICSQDSGCVYHLHHWWFGFVLVMLSTSTLDNWFDYFLQGVFWTFLIESIFNYGLVFGEFFI